MSSFDRQLGDGQLGPSRRLRATLAVAAVFGLSIALAGCGSDGGSGFQPLYGTNSSGQSFQEVMASVSVQTIPGRVGQQVRNELIFKTTGGGEAAPPVYLLEIALKETAQSELVKLDGDSQGIDYRLKAAYKITRVADNSTVFEGSASAQAPFAKNKSIFSNIRARRDAENRAAKSLADNIKTQVAAVLSK